MEKSLSEILETINEVVIRAGGFTATAFVMRDVIKEVKLLEADKVRLEKLSNLSEFRFVTNYETGEVLLDVMSGNINDRYNTVISGKDSLRDAVDHLPAVAETLVVPEFDLVERSQATCLKCGALNPFHEVTCPLSSMCPACNNPDARIREKEGTDLYYCDKCDAEYPF